MAKTPFKLRSGNKTSFKDMGSSPVRQGDLDDFFTALGSVPGGLVKGVKDIGTKIAEGFTKAKEKRGTTVKENVEKVIEDVGQIGTSFKEFATKKLSEGASGGFGDITKRTTPPSKHEQKKTVTIQGTGNDPWEYQKEGDVYKTRKKGSDVWITPKSTMQESIKTKIFASPVEKKRSPARDYKKGYYGIK